jgi:hypothetical protein
MAAAITRLLTYSERASANLENLYAPSRQS